LGADAGANLFRGSHNIHIGNQGFEESGAIRIGTTGVQTKTFVAGISGATVPTGVAVIVDGSGHLGTITSSAHYKQNIQPMDKTSEAILALQPVTFRYKQEIDPQGTPQFGLVAEEVEKVNPNLVARDAHGKAYTVRYEAVNAMLLNEFIKEHQKVQRLEAALAAVNERLKAQDAKIDKVNAKVELTKPAPQVVVNDQ
jgi:Chaperone of endosialidase